MPNFDTPIVINDGKPTPVAHTFSPERKDGLEASWVDRSGGLIVGYPRIKATHVLPAGRQPLGKVNLRITVPELEISTSANAAGFTPAPTLAFMESGNVQFVFHERATKQQRKDARVYMANLLLSAAAISMIDDFEPAY